MAAIALLVGCAGLANRLIDPYGYFRDVEIRGWNSAKPLAAGQERMIKPALVARIRPQAVIVGNSVAEIGLPPTHPLFTEGGALSSYNLALPRATWNEVYCLAMYAMREASVKRLVVGISGADDAPCPSDAELARLDYGKVLFSRTALAASRDTLRRQDSRSAVTREGLWSFLRYDEHMRGDDDVAANFAVSVRDEICPSAQRPPREFDRMRVDTRAPPPGQGMGLRKLIRLAAARNTELVLLSYPTHVALSEIRRRCHGAEAHWTWLWQIASIVDQEAGSDSPSVQFWDFSGYQPMNGERIYANKPMPERAWQDAVHFNVEVGAAVFDAVYRQRQEIGTRVGVADFDEFLARGEERRRAFLASNEWVSREVDGLVRRAQALPAPAAR